jgi:hypothetical protein
LDSILNDINSYVGFCTFASCFWSQKQPQKLQGKRSGQKQHVKQAAKWQKGANHGEVV